MISATMLTKNSARYLRKVLESARGFDEVVVLDSGSCDDTREIAREFPNVNVRATVFKGFGPLHNEASARARNDWIFSLDSDEVVTPELAREIAALSLDPGAVYSVERRNFYRGKWIRWCGWHPDRQLRLYHRERTRWSDAQVHESVITEGMRVVPLKHPLEHYPYEGLADFLTKMQHYSDLFAKQHQGRMSSSLSKAVAHGLGTFVRNYVLKKGFLGGREGFIISVYTAQLAYYKYLKLFEANEKLASDSEAKTG